MDITCSQRRNIEIIIIRSNKTTNYITYSHNAVLCTNLQIQAEVERSAPFIHQTIILGRFYQNSFQYQRMMIFTQYREIFIFRTMNVSRHFCRSRITFQMFSFPSTKVALSSTYVSRGY